MVSMTFYLFYIRLPPSWPQFLQPCALLKGLSAPFENNHRSLDDGVLLGDSPFLMTPFATTRTLPQEAYNSAHTKTRVVIEQTSGRWKRRFHVLHAEIGCLRSVAQHCLAVKDGYFRRAEILFMGFAWDRRGRHSVARNLLIIATVYENNIMGC